MRSNLYSSLKWKYRREKFLSLTEAGKEAIVALVHVVVCIAVATYFYAHIIVWIIK